MLVMCGSRKYLFLPPPHRGSWKFQGVEGCERGKIEPEANKHVFRQDGHQRTTIIAVS